MFVVIVCVFRQHRCTVPGASHLSELKIKNTFETLFGLHRRFAPVIRQTDLTGIRQMLVIIGESQTEKHQNLVALIS